MKHLERALDKQNQWWKYLVVFVSGFLGANLIGAVPLLVVILYKTAQSGGRITPNPDNFADFSVYGISSNLGLILMILPFVIGLITVVLLFKPLHKRTFKEVINGTNRIRWRKFLFAALIWGLIMFICSAIDYCLNPTNYQLNLNISSFIPLIFISLLLIPFQTTFEEILFRGYLSQGVAAWTKSRWLVLVIPALLFAFMHAFNPEVKEYGFWLTMPQYLLFGLLFGLVTILDDGIETAMGAHAANNVFASVFITNKASALQTSALFNQQNVDPVKDTFIFIAICVVFLAILSYKYKWKYAILNKKVQLNN